MKQALYRKYRPSTFDQVKGQESIVNILKNQIKSKKISHAYIFSGTRGTGKTSTAKIFAKAVNCLNPENGNPCNKCTNCLLVQNETTMDIVEMDAASNRRIDDIRQLRDQVIYPPTTLKYKVYIIDEAHMITNEGFNALLKIMEEPPSHLIFILATTLLDSIPDTILSRAQRFDFKSLSIDEIKNQVSEISKLEGVNVHEEAVEVVANIASGAMRDGLSILDQVISIGKADIKAEDVYDLLGIFSEQVKRDFVVAIFNKDIKTVLQIIETEISKGKSTINFIKDMLVYFKDMLYQKAGVSIGEGKLNLESISLDRLVNSIDILLEYEDLMKKSDTYDLLFRVCAIRLIDYMPRNHLEAKIKNLEERLYYLEKNRVTDDVPNTKFIRDNSEKPVSAQEFQNLMRDFVEENEEVESVLVENENLEIVDIEVLVEFKEDKEGNTLSESSTQEKDVLDSTKSDASEILYNILTEKYSHTKLLFEGLKDMQTKGERIVFFIDKEHISYASSMGYFFDKAKKDLFDLTSKNYEIKFELFEEKSENKYRKETEDKLRALFPEDKFKVIE